MNIFKRTESHEKLFGDPSGEHLNSKIISWILACVFAGTMLSVYYPEFGEDKMLRNNRRTARVIPMGRVRINGRARTRNKELVLK
jgi:hypothetical protein